MHFKTVFISLGLVSTTVLIAAGTHELMPQDPTSQDPVTTNAAPESRTTPPATHSDLTRLRAALERAMRSAAAADARVRELTRRSKAAKTELGEALDIIATGGLTLGVRERHQSCSRSRARVRSIITHFEWMKERGHTRHADKILARVVKVTGNHSSQINRLARDLMTNKETAGKFNRAALALAELMQKKGDLQDSYYDTIALAMFLNGRVKEAVTAQTRATKGSDKSDYRRRLMVYEAALRNLAQPAPASESAPASAPATVRVGITQPQDQ